MYRKPVWESFFPDPIFKAWDLDEFEINILNAFIQNNYQPIRNNSLLDDYLFQLLECYSNGRKVLNLKESQYMNQIVSPIFKLFFPPHALR